MSKVCLECFEIYKDSLIFDALSDYQFCPKYSCLGEVVEVDELMLPIIIELNKKGYHTKYCCASHYYERPIDSYIMFADNIKLPSLPKNYVLENDMNTIRYSVSNRGNISNYKFFDIINKNANQLLKWAKSLPYYEED